ncbi:MAG: 2-amino-4-hydroxy-6-hydroxymethyldihydropteridine diphosphokinase [Prevotella sp.]|nr:2-amino-4-hydroxy-6-hydroxymethyldihydropteridine diphosphokinase [Prevotella sp.]
MHIVYLSLGTNLGYRRRNIRRAIAKIGEQIGAVVRQSALYETEPWGFESSHRFMNAAICVETSLTPRELLTATQDIERQLGRTHKTRKNADGLPAEGTEYQDRLIDIDILLYDDISVDEPDLKIPHPLMCERDFVMRPLREINPTIDM